MSSSSCSGRIRFDSCSLYPENEIGPSISSSVVLCPFGLYCSACLGILFVSILCMCCSHFSWYCFIFFTIWDVLYKNIKKNERKMTVKNVTCIWILTIQFIYICTSAIPRSLWVQHYKLGNESHSPWKKPLPMKYSLLPRPTTGVMFLKNCLQMAFGIYRVDSVI